MKNKEQIENKLYLQKCKAKLSETFDFEIQRMTESLERLKEEDQLILDELKRAEESIQTKKHTLKYYDERIEALKEQIEKLQGETAERRGQIEELKRQIESTRYQIEELGDEEDDEEARRLKAQIEQKSAEIKELEAKVAAKEAEYDEWRQRINIKHQVISRRSKSRKREYNADPSDDIDVIIANYINSMEDPVPIQKLGFRRYIIGTNIIEVEDDVKLGPVVILKSGETIPLQDFLVIVEEEGKKLSNMREDEELVITDKSIRSPYGRESREVYSHSPQQRNYANKSKDVYQYSNQSPYGKQKF